MNTIQLNIIRYFVDTMVFATNIDTTCEKKVYYRRSYKEKFLDKEDQEEADARVSGPGPIKHL